MKKIVLWVGLLCCVACGQTAVEPPTPTPTMPTPTATPTTEPQPAPLLGLHQPVIVNRYPHDSNAFTQGLLWHDGQLYESTGLYGQSDLRRVSLETGEVEQIIPIGDSYFAEGLTLVNDRLIMITWRERTAFIFDSQTFEQLGTFNYETEGWGICYDGTYLYMSDGTDTIYQRDPDTFAVIEQIKVQGENGSVNRLNELECVGEQIYANIWLTDRIVVINKVDGQVQATIDASNLLTPEERATLSHDAVLNGIAYNPETDTFYLTGKLWSQLFEVRFER